MRVADDGFVECVPAFLLTIGYFKSQCRFGNAIDLSEEISPFIMKEGLTVSDEELQVANLRGVNRRIVDLRYAA